MNCLFPRLKKKNVDLRAQKYTKMHNYEKLYLAIPRQKKIDRID